MPRLEYEEDNYGLSCIRSLRLDPNGLMELFKCLQCVFSVIRDQTDRNPNWCRRILIGISHNLRICLRNWIIRHYKLMRKMYEIAYEEQNPEIQGSISSRLESGIDGMNSSDIENLLNLMIGSAQKSTRRRCTIWPTMMLITTLLPHRLMEAYALCPEGIYMDRSPSGPVRIILQGTSEKFWPNTFRSFLRDTQEFLECSLLSYIQFMDVAAILKGHKTVSGFAVKGDVLIKLIEPCQNKMITSLLTTGLPSLTF